MPSIFDNQLVPLEKKADYDSKVIPAEWTDQWLREYVGKADNKSFHPTGALEPLNWRPPSPLLFPPSHVLEFKPRKMGWLRVNVDRWFSLESSAWREWTAEKGIHATRRFGEMAFEGMENDNRHLMQLVGASPMHLDFLRAMKANNAWVLGQNDPNTGKPYPKGYVPQWACKFYYTLTRIETVDDFVSDMGVDPGKFADEVLTAGDYRAAAGQSLPPEIRAGVRLSDDFRTETDDDSDETLSARELERRELLEQLNGRAQFEDLDDDADDAPKVVAGATGTSTGNASNKPRPSGKPNKGPTVPGPVNEGKGQ